MRIGQRKSARSIRELCSLLGYTRQAYYKHIRFEEKTALEYELLLQQVALLRKSQKRIGTRKMLFILGDFITEHKFSIGRDAFFDLLRKNNLLVRRRRGRKPQTTFSKHWHKKYDNLIIGFVPTAANQLWVSDITYINLENEFAYLNLITDAYSRKIIGFYLCKDLSAKGTIHALRMALHGITKRENKSSRLVHHSDRGLQYCSNDYVNLLNDNFIDISMTQTGDPLDNALAERVNGILKDELLEEVYPDFKQAQSAVALAISIYNYQRPHSSVDMLTPAKAHEKIGELKRHWKNYYSIKKEKEVDVA